MWLLVAIALVVGGLFVVSVRAWISILGQESDRRACPACKSRMVMTTTRDEPGLAYLCTRCGKSEPFGRQVPRGGLRWPG